MPGLTGEHPGIKPAIYGSLLPGGLHPCNTKRTASQSQIGRTKNKNANPKSRQKQVVKGNKVRSFRKLARHHGCFRFAKDKEVVNKRKTK